VPSFLPFAFLHSNGSSVIFCIKRKSSSGCKFFWYTFSKVIFALILTTICSTKQA
jgi:hypothetical protein